MEKKRTLNFGFAIIAFILGTSLIREFDFENQTFENNSLAILYGITFAFSIYFLIKDYVKPPKK